MISGLHTSINIHLCSNYLLQDSLTNPGGTWGINKNEFQRRFSPEGSGGEGPQWLKNLYFLYLLELRALAKASETLERADFYTGRAQEDADLQLAVRDLLKVKTFTNRRTISNFVIYRLFEVSLNISTSRPCLRAARLRWSSRETSKTISATLRGLWTA